MERLVLGQHTPLEQPVRRTERRQLHALRQERLPDGGVAELAGAGVVSAFRSPTNCSSRTTCR